MRITIIATAAATVLAITVAVLGCNSQTPPAKAPQPLPAQARFNDIDSAICALDSMMNAAEIQVGQIQSGIRADTRFIKPPQRVISPLFIDEGAVIIESN